VIKLFIAELNICRIPLKDGLCVNKLINLALSAAKMAGAVIMINYRHVLVVERKLDGSPLTVADKEAHEVIGSQLAKSGLAVISEESDDLMLDAERYWLVDPLDGTKDFLAGNDEFTINIALINAGRPVMGVLFAPAIDVMYWGAANLGAWMMQFGSCMSLLPKPKSAICSMAISRFHDHPDVDIFATDNRISNRIAVGSALKYGLLSSAGVDVFPRLVGSSEWDTAAGQAILEAAGGWVLDWHTGMPLRYGKRKRRNPRLIAFRSPYRYDDFKMKIYSNELL